jgi:hypothetical protein
VLASRLLRAAPFAVGAVLLLAGTSSALAAEKAQRSAGAIVNNVAALPTVSDGPSDRRGSVRAAGLLGADAFAPIGNITAQHHGAAGGHLPATRHNIELVGELQVNTPPEFRADPNTGAPDPTQPPVVPEQIADVAVHKGYAYLNSWDEPGCARGGTFIVDINNPRAPQQVGFIPALAGRYHGEGAHVVTLNTPVFQGDILAVNNEPYSLCAPDLSVEGGFDLYNVTNPRQPSTFKQGVGDTQDGPGLGTHDPALAHSYHSVFVWQGNDRRAFAVAVDNIEDPDVDIFEITNPADPQPVGDFDLDQLFDIEDNSALGDSRFLHDMVVKKIGDRFVLLASYWDSGYVMVDLTNPANPQYMGDSSFDDPDPLTGWDPPEGNAHQAEFSHDNRYIVAADEDFGACRFDARIASGPFEDNPLIGVEGTDTPPLCPDIDLQGATRFVGTACEGDPVPPADNDHPVALVLRGGASATGCFFQNKYDNAIAAGYEAVLVMNSDSTNGGCDSLLNPLVEGDPSVPVPFLFVPRTVGLWIMGVAEPYTCVANGNPADDTPTPAAGTDGNEVEVTPEFDGWGYAHLYSSTPSPRAATASLPAKPAEVKQIDSYAIDEALSRNYVNGYGDLSIHEFATDPTENIAYSSYYSGGMRVFSFGDGGLVEQGRFVDPRGSNFWGVEQFTGADGERYFAGSDRDFGLQIFRYTGPGAAQRPVCTDSVTMVPYKQSASVSLPCSDANGNPLTRATTTAPTGGTLAGVGTAATATYTHTGNRLGNADQFQFTAADGAATSAPATARIVAVPRSGGRCFNPFVGTAARETLTGSPFGDRLRGGRGNDTLEGRGGADCLAGQGGRDTARGGNGNDTVEGGDGRDRLFGNNGNDTARGGDGNDTIEGGDGRDRLFGSGGNDRIEANAGRRQLLSGGAGRDRLFAANGQRDRIRCGKGRDRVRADRGDRVARDCESVSRKRRRR